MFHPFRQFYALLLCLDAAWTQRRERRAAEKAAPLILLPDGSTHLRPAPPRNATLAAARLEGRWGPLPRPVNEQYLNSFAALRRLLDRLSRTLVLLISALASFALFTVGLTYWHSLLRRWGLVGPFSGRNVWGYTLALLLCAGLGLLVVFFDGGKIWQIFVQFQRDSYGTAAWATLRELAAKGLVWEWDPATLVPFGAPERASGMRWRVYRFLERRLLRRSVTKLPRHPLLLGHVPLAPLGRTQWFCLPLEQFARHCLVYGPPGSGKSASFLLLQARAFARLGSAIILDLKGELWQFDNDIKNK